MIIVNKFGAQEAGGGGLRDELLAAADAGIPVLTTIKPDVVDAWREFVGELGTVLPARTDEVLAWCRKACAPTCPHAHRGALPTTPVMHPAADSNPRRRPPAPDGIR